MRLRGRSVSLLRAAGGLGLPAAWSLLAVLAAGAAIIAYLVGLQREFPRLPADV